jgi:hypothetical protein
VADDSERFADEIRRLVEKKANEMPPVIHRQEVEGVGHSLGMSEEEACNTFWVLRGDVWNVSTDSLYNTDSLYKSLRPSDDPPEPSRRWVAVNDVMPTPHT